MEKIIIKKEELNKLKINNSFNIHQRIDVTGKLMPPKLE